MKKLLSVILMVTMVLTLAACGSNTKTKTWDISAVNSEGVGIEGVTLQVCTSSACYVLTTDAEGAVDFNGTENSCEVQVLKCPDGYTYTGDDVTAKKNEKCQIVLETATVEEAQTTETANTTVTATQTEDGRVKISFSSTDMQDSAVDDSIFAQNKVTMINLWEPWCSPCKSEMPDLEKLYQEYKGQGFMILGVHEYEDDLESVVSEAGVTYPIVNTTDEFLSIINETCSYPTSFFVDSEGYILLPTEELADTVLQNKINYYKEYYKELIKEYQNGEFDEYKDDEDYAESFAELDEMIEDSSKIDATVQELVNGSIDTERGYFIGYNQYDNWKLIIESFLDEN